jgi:hypothetical protein
VTPCLNNGDAAVRARAEDVPRQLEAIIAEWTKAGHGNGIHILFAELYLCTTRNWLTRLERRSDSTYAYHVICNFLELFHDFVVSGVVDQSGHVPVHWDWYRRLSARLTATSSILAQLTLVFLGARAHTHHDLGLAMVKADQHSSITRHAPMTHTPAIFRPMSSEAFFQASLDFVQLQRTRNSGRNSAYLWIIECGLVATKPAWLLMFQSWRRSGYHNARRATVPVTALPQI